MRHVAEPKGWFVATNRRVLNPETRRRREVDLILIHERRWMIIEQKHWSGRVEVLDDGRFIQHRPKGGRQDHGAIAETIDMKAGLASRQDTTIGRDLFWKRRRWPWCSHIREWSWRSMPTRPPPRSENLRSDRSIGGK